MKSILLIRNYLKAKVLVLISQKLGKGRGTSLPGIGVEKRYPELLKELGRGFEKIILISGTNGKTTTRALLTHIYESMGVAVCSNRGGANLIRGIATSLLLNLNLKLQPKAKVAIFEVEEASLPILCKYLKADTLILTNVFRDQLDAYGEVNKTVGYFRQTLLNLGVKLVGDESEPVNLELVYNGEDQKLIELADSFEVKKIAFGLDIEDHKKPKYESKKKTDSVQIGNFLQAKNVETKNLVTSFDLKIEGNANLKINSQLPGFYNVYNILAAISVAYPIFGTQIVNPINTFKPAFGRGERIKYQNTEIVLFLIKNPAGFDQVLDLLESNYSQQKLNLAICINDNIADGKDVSWLWDVDIEQFVKRQKLENFYTSGTRGLDMLLRFEYAGKSVTTENNFETNQDLLAKIEEKTGEFVVLCTYTALMDFRKLLESKTELGSFDGVGN